MFEVRELDVLEPMFEARCVIRSKRISKDEQAVLYARALELENSNAISI